MTEEFKTEVHEYLYENGYYNGPRRIGNDLFHYSDNAIMIVNVTSSKSGKEKKLKDDWEKDEDKMNRYFLEYIRHILIKHNITKISTYFENRYVYKSTKWKFDTIEYIEITQ